MQLRRLVHVTPMREQSTTCTSMQNLPPSSGDRPHARTSIHIHACMPHLSPPPFHVAPCGNKHPHACHLSPLLQVTPCEGIRLLLNERNVADVQVSIGGGHGPCREGTRSLCVRVCGAVKGRGGPTLSRYALEGGHGPCGGAPCVSQPQPTAMFPLSSPLALSRISLFTRHPRSCCPHMYGVHMQAELDGPTGTPFEGGLFRLRLVLPSDFPAAPPKVRMTSRGVDLSPQAAHPSPEGPRQGGWGGLYPVLSSPCHASDFRPNSYFTHKSTFTHVCPLLVSPPPPGLLHDQEPPSQRTLLTFHPSFAPSFSPSPRATL